MSKPLTDVNVCHVPKRMPPGDAAVYQQLREAHCEGGHTSRECAGRVIVDRNGVTLACPLCGDARALFPQEAGPDA